MDRRKDIIVAALDLPPDELGNEGHMELIQLPKVGHLDTADAFRVVINRALHDESLITFPLEESGRYSAIEQAYALFNAIKTQRLTFDQVLAQKDNLDASVKSQ